MFEDSKEILIILAVGVLLIVQVYALTRIRKTMAHVAQYLKMVNVVFREFTKAHEISTANALKETERLAADIAQSSIKTNQKNSCQICKFRISFVKIQSDKLGFQYQCGITKKEVGLDYWCEQFEVDLESKPYS